jgi:hypothetical protein
MKEIKKFEFEGNEITFLTGENIIMNATEMAKKFLCQPIDWLKTDNAQRLIVAYSVRKNISTGDLVIVRQGGDPNKQGTWMHQDIALIFAQWLSPEFYIWCNDRIKELFKYGFTTLKEETREKLFKLSELTSNIQEQYPYKVGKYKIYEDLRQRGILDTHNKPLQKYIEKGYFKFKLYRDDEYRKYPTATEEGLKWITQLLFPDASDNGRISILEAKVDLLLKSNEVIMEKFLISTSTSITIREEQNRINTEKMRDICSKIRSLTDDISPMLNLPDPIIQLKLDTY